MLNELCQEHNSQYTNICIDDHQCQERRLCVKCIFTSHVQIPRENLPLLDNFFSLIIHKFNSFERANYKPIITQIDQLIEKINQSLQQIKLFVKRIIEERQNADKKFLELKEKLQKIKSIQEYSKNEINFMFRIQKQQYNKEEQNDQIRKENIKNGLNKISEFCVSLSQKLMTLDNSQYLENGLLIQGMKTSCLRHGSFYFVFPDGSKEFAGSYDFGLKQGIWKNYQKQEQQDIMEVVNYNNGMQQEILYSEKTNIYYKIAQKKRFQVIGEANDKKQGNQREIIQSYKNQKEIHFCGEYQNGVKIGKWVIEFMEQVIGGGVYNDNGIKIGKWTDLDQNFNVDYFVTHSGVYNNGVREKKWYISNKEKIIGGGNYNEQGIKIGDWIEIDFSSYLVTHQGEYQNGIKVGMWQIRYKNNIIGGGNYNQQGRKMNKWTDIDEQFNDEYIVTHTGEYNNGVRVHQWQIFFQEIKIGGGVYENGIKTGDWTEIDEQYGGGYDVIYSGQYKNGIRVGQWVSQYKVRILGGGIYNEQGNKTGSWTEFEKLKACYCLVSHTGEYNNGRHVGKWLTTVDMETIGGGTYNNKGIKHGKWIELDETSNNQFYQISSGQYKNGIKVGKWLTEDQKINHYHNDSLAKIDFIQIRLFQFKKSYFGKQIQKWDVIGFPRDLQQEDWFEYD